MWIIIIINYQAELTVQIGSQLDGIIIIMARMAVFFSVAGYLIEERHRWPVITASPRGQCSK